jgi:hypothetical protein
VSYDLVISGNIADYASPEATLMLLERPPGRPGGRAAAFLDGRVEMLSDERIAELQRPGSPDGGSAR